MRSALPALQLLALCYLSLASVCRPYSSSVNSVLPTTITEPSSTESASSTTISSTTLLVETDSSTTLSYTTTLSEDSSTSESGSASSETESIASDSSTILATLVTTSSAELSTTTSTSISQEPTALLLNPDFENKDGIAPWVRLGSFGSATVSTSEFHGDSQSGYFTGAPGGPASMGFRQPIDASKMEAGKEYRFSVYAKVTQAVSCSTIFVSCGAENSYFNSATFGGNGDWTLATITCSWTQESLDAGPNVRVQGICERLSFYIDDAAFEEVVASG